jgi:hypothetical protein
MKRMRLDEGKMQAGKSGALAMPPVCVCGAGLNETAHGFPVGPICPACGGIQLRAEASARQEHRHLQDFLSAFV